MNDYIGAMRRFIVSRDAGLEPMFHEYAEEAKFGYRVLATDLKALPEGASILEVGAGSLILSTLLRRDGFDVTALEPVGSGFSHFHRLQTLVLEFSRQCGAAPKMLRQTGESLAVAGEFDFAFSINVMEHVNDFGVVIERVYTSVKEGGKYRFVCPNYDFPYEPHFNIPTLFSRGLTERVFLKRILQSKAVMDPQGTWDSLNWISTRKVARICKTRLGVSPSFQKATFDIMLNRAFNDEAFRNRRGTFIPALLKVFRQAGLLKLTGFIPAFALPIIDCSVEKPSGSGVARAGGQLSKVQRS